MMARHNFIVLGARPKADKGALCYFDENAGMWAVKILQLREDLELQTGDSFELDDVEGSYITIYFANQRGRESLRRLRDCLDALDERWEEGRNI